MATSTFDALAQRAELAKQEEEVCVVCGGQIDILSVCDNCGKEGWWMDPAGGLHKDSEDGSFSDPAAMYE